MAVFKCKMCGGNLDVAEETTVCECEYCGTKQTVPKTRDDVMSNLFNRANNLRIKCEFDKAQEIYEKIVASDPTEAEAYWGLVLCKYGIEYVEDPATFRKIPTCHRTQLESVMTDVDYLAAVERADVVQRSVYEEEARAIDKLQKDILEIVHKEQPFDVFICYKETDESGKRTGDSVIANDIYYQLTNEGFKVFYAAITLEDKLGQEYEPYIFAALNSARVMLVIGSKAEYFNAVWVKNEWSRYMKLMKSDRSKLLIPCYKDMDAYDLPEEFSHLQAQDMSKIGFINDVIRGIKKVIVKEDAPKAPAPAQTVVSAPASANVENLLKRGMLSLEDGKWEEADRFFEQVLNENVEEPRAYFGKMLSSLKANSEERLLQTAPRTYSPLTNNEHYKKAKRFAGEEYRAYLVELNKRYVYASGINSINSAKKEEDFLAAKTIFDKLTDYQPACQKSSECVEKAHEVVYQNACKILSGKSDTSLLDRAMSEFGRISDYKDSEQKKAQCAQRIKEVGFALCMKCFNSAETESDYLAAKDFFDRIADYQPAIEKSAECIQKIEQIQAVEKERLYQDALRILTSDSTELELRTAISQFKQIAGWKDSGKRIDECRERIDSINAKRKQEEERRRLQAEKKAKKRRIITAVIFAAAAVVAAFSVVLVMVIIPNQRYNNAVLLKNEGKYTEAISAFEEMDGYKDSADQILDCEYNLAVSLMNEGKYGEAISTFRKYYGQTEYKDTRELLIKCLASYPKGSISAGSALSVGLKSDGTVVTVGIYYEGRENVSTWTDITAVSAGEDYSIGLKSDGTVVASDYTKGRQSEISDWSDIIAIWTETRYPVGLTNEGRVVSTHTLFEGDTEITEWENITSVAIGGPFIAGLKSDGTVVTAGENYEGRCDVSGWTDIVAISAENDCTIGLKADGTVVATGKNVYGQCDVSNWRDIVDISTGKWHTVGLKSDGTVVATGRNKYGECDVSGWTDIVAISAGKDFTIGLKSDGTMVATGNNWTGQCKVSDWTDIKTTND